MIKAKINLLGGKLFEYIPHTLGLLDKGIKNIEIHGFGGSANQALVLAQMLNQLHGKKMKYDCNARIYESKTKFSSLNSIMAEIEFGSSNKLLKEPVPQNVENLIHEGFLDFPTYQLLFQRILDLKDSIKISIELYPNGGETVDLLEIKPIKNVHGHYEINILLNNLKLRQGKNSSRLHEKLKIFRDRLGEVLYRSGYLMPENWEEIGTRLANFDDIIVGLDTCVLKDTFVSTSLLPILSVIEKHPYVQTPNWILFVIPQMVIYELEKAANMKENNGHFSHPGRRGFRALQEIIELRKNVGHTGVSVVNTGNADTMLDVNSFLKSINENLISLVNNNNQSGRKNGFRTPKSASGDMLIRSQFNAFVDGINFKKGTYFLTSDKINAAMCTTAGNDSIYIPKPLLRDKQIIESPQLIPNVCRTIPIGTLLYELAVDFGKLYMHIDDSKVVKLECDLKGKSLTPWIRKQLRISKYDLSTLIDEYPGKFDLFKVQEFYRGVAEQLEKIDWSLNEKIDFED